MDDYALSQSRARAPYGVWGKFVQFVSNWRSRRTFARLRHVSDHQLHDIGLTRIDVQRLASLPLSLDPSWEAERVRLHRSKHGTK